LKRDTSTFGRDIVFSMVKVIWMKIKIACWGIQQVFWGRQQRRQASQQAIWAYSKCFGADCQTATPPTD